MIKLLSYEVCYGPGVFSRDVDQADLELLVQDFRDVDRNDRPDKDFVYFGEFEWLEGEKRPDPAFDNLKMTVRTIVPETEHADGDLAALLTRFEAFLSKHLGFDLNLQGPRLIDGVA